ncbi:MAG TPA: hypothetical protein VFI08_15340 [Spirochaetia bacterium]|nr:hypothetical protein [Spirochaetia bacterium]
MKPKGLWESVYYSVVTGQTLTVTTSRYRPAERAHIDRIFGAYLRLAGMGHLHTNLTYCVHELVANARKANTKRVYFHERGLDIRDPEQYAQGMQGFKSDTVADIDAFLARQKKAGLNVKIDFSLLPSGVSVMVRNNAELTEAEHARIRDKLAIAARHQCLADAFPRSEDGLEGAGLGIVMMSFMLRNLGFGTDTFQLTSGDGETRASLTLRLPPERLAAGPQGASA